MSEDWKMWRKVLSTMSLVLLLSACSGGGGSGVDAPESSAKTRNLSPAVGPASERSVVTGVNSLGLDLVANITGNVVVAPFSAALSLSWLRAGAQGETLTALNGVMNPGSIGEVHTALNSLDLGINSRIGSGVQGGMTSHTSAGGWAQARYGYRLDYLDILAENYGLKPSRVDFALSPENASQTVSDWASQASGGLSTQVTITDKTRLVLGSAVNLDVAWTDPFDPLLTETGGFQRLDSATLNVPFMRKSAVLPMTSGDGYVAVGLGVSGGQQFLVLLPDNGRFTEIQTSLTAERLEQIAAALLPAQVDLALPQFTIASSISFDLGPASSEGIADFSGIDGTRELYTSATVHHSRLVVNETGLQAGSATVLALEDSHPETWPDSGGFWGGVIISTESFPSIDVILGRPFIFAVRDLASGAILFMGKVMDPSL